VQRLRTVRLRLDQRVSGHGVEDRVDAGCDLGAGCRDADPDLVLGVVTAGVG
jgi:hypothetical protein